MDRKSFSAIECPIARATDEVGDAWSLLILRSAFLGVRCFQDFEARLDVPASTLTRKLKRLCDRGLLRKVRYASHPPRSEYRLTEKGRSLLPVLLSLAAWGNRWLAPEGAPLLAVDRRSLRPLELVLCERKSKRRVSAADVALSAGPGASRALRAQMQRPIAFGASEDA
jgi:DNA-binding HxlR family transcriptional regulator